MTLEAALAYLETARSCRLQLHRRGASLTAWTDRDHAPELNSTTTIKLGDHFARVAVRQRIGESLPVFICRAANELQQRQRAGNPVAKPTPKRTFDAALKANRSRLGRESSTVQ